MPGHEFGADQLIERIVSADIFPERLQIAIKVEECRRVQPTGALEDRLRAAQAPGNRLITSASTGLRSGARRTAGRTRIDSSDVLPHTPQLDDVNE